MSHLQADRASYTNEETPETMTPKPRAITTTARRAARALGLALALLCLSAASATAAPVLDVELTHDAANVTDTDERVDYLVEVSNVAALDESPEIGETLTCDNTAAWSGSPTPTLSYQWIRNGAPIDGATSSTYTPNTTSTTTPASTVGDEGETIQCRVTATNSSGVAVQASIPVTVVDPQPAQAPPRCTSANIQGCRPVFDSEVAVNPEETRECIAPTGSWEGDSLTWTLRWIVNGEVEQTTVGTSSTFLFEAEHEGTIFQCEASATDDAGAEAQVHSIRRSVTEGGAVVTGNAPAFAASRFPRAQFDALGKNDTSGPVTLEVDLPHRPGTYAYRLFDPANPSSPPAGWSCLKLAPSAAQAARVLCNRSDTLKADSSYPGLGIVTALDESYVAPEIVTATATVGGGGAEVNASDSDLIEFLPNPFRLTRFETGVCDETGIGVGPCEGIGADNKQAGGHPFVGIAEFDFPVKRLLNPPSGSQLTTSVEMIKQVFTDLPRGFVGNTLAVPELCPNAIVLRRCPEKSIVGGIRLQFPTLAAEFPLYAIEPEAGTPAQFGFSDPFNNTYTLSARLRPEDGYAVSLDLAPSPIVAVLHSTAMICGFGGRRNEPAREFIGCKEEGDPDAYPRPLFTNPTRCEGQPPTVKVKLNSWENPTRIVESEWSTPALEGCEEVDFEPQMSLKPTSSQADSPTGLDVELEMPTEGLETKDGISQANFKRARITFPEGMAINASAGHDLASCSAEQAGFSEQGGKLVPNDQPAKCPGASKVGTIEIETPILKRTLTGAVHIARQGAIDDSLVGLWLIFESKRDGIIVKQPAKVELDPKTGQLTTVVDESPEAPFSKVSMSFPGGNQATLLTPPKCGTYQIKAELSSWAASDPDNPKPSEIVTDTSTFKVTGGPNGGPCPNDALLPTLEAGSTNPLAGQASPFTMRLHRPDGSDRFTALTLRPPAGLTAYLKGVPLCPEALIAKAEGREEPGEGQDELDDPSCPAASQLGRVIAGAGAGPKPFYVDTGKAYLAGPYKGAPLSIVAITPAVAGPLDLGNVVVRNAVHVNPVTAEIRVVSDPIPHILHGVLLDVRDVRVEIDRPRFTANPTSCAPKRVVAEVKGLVETAIAQPSNPFQVGNCRALGFKPKTRVQLFGGVKRGKYQGVKAVVRPRPGDSNIAGTVVRFPRSAFVAQEHLRNICTRVQFAADACPKASIYGKAVAWSPLLDHPLEGNVHLRSSDNTLPDLVADLRGPAWQPIRVEVAVRNDSVKGALRNTVQAVPDAPVSYFRLQTFGGNKGLIVNSRNICRGKNQARVAMSAHNGRRSVEKVNVFNRRCKALKKKQRAKRRKARPSMHRSKRSSASARRAR